MRGGGAAWKPGVSAFRRPRPPLQPPVTCSARSFPGPFWWAWSGPGWPRRHRGSSEETGFPEGSPRSSPLYGYHVLSSCVVSAPGHPSCRLHGPRTGCTQTRCPPGSLCCVAPGPHRALARGVTRRSRIPPGRAGRGCDLWSVRGLTTHDYVRHTFFSVTSSVIEWSM